MKKKYNIPCILGFVFSVLIPIPTLVCSYYIFMKKLHDRATYAFCGRIAIAAVIVGLIVSLIGVITSRNSGVKGRKLGFAGLIFSGVELVCCIVLLAGIIWMTRGIQMSN